MQLKWLRFALQCFKLYPVTLCFRSRRLHVLYIYQFDFPAIVTDRSEGIPHVACGAVCQFYYPGCHSGLRPPVQILPNMNSTSPCTPAQAVLLLVTATGRYELYLSLLRGETI